MHNEVLLNLSEELKESNFINLISTELNKKFNFEPTFGVEIEFYLSNEINVDQFEERLGYKVIKEKGRFQYEINLPATNDLEAYCVQIGVAKAKIMETAIAFYSSADFSAKPNSNDYGNSMHFHLSLGEKGEKYLETAAKSLCYFMLQTCVIFLPSAEDYKRLDWNYMAPTHVAFGGNNRSVAIRIPESLPKRLEHRLATPSSDPYLCMSAILQAIRLGMSLKEEDLAAYDKIYGLAFDPQYNLNRLPTSLAAAKKLFNVNFFKID